MPQDFYVFVNNTEFWAVIVKWQLQAFLAVSTVRCKRIVRKRTVASGLLIIRRVLNQNLAIGVTTLQGGGDG
jgi:hypothetical protein